MRAAVWEAGSPLRVETIPIPVPRAGEALVQVSACGVCHTDLHVMKGEVRFPSPAVLGHEISGRVVEIGLGTRPEQIPAGIELGDRVVGAFIMPCGTCRRCESGRDDLCERFFELNRLRGVLYDGTSRLERADGSSLAMYSMAGLAEYCVIPLTALAALPHDLPEFESAVLGCAGLTAFGAVHRASGITEGDAVAVIAVGGIGLSIVQLARAAGASTVVAVDLDDAKLRMAADLGATHTINARAESDPVAAVRALVPGGVDVAFEAIGTPATLAQAVAMLAEGGRAVAVGIAAGDAAVSIPITPLVRRAQSIVGSFGARTRTDLPEVIRLSLEGRLSLADTVSRSYDLDEVAAAFDDLGRGAIAGRAIVRMR
ncbi:MAG: alcohol dehydrogenase [Micrococcales bacterium 70-64]|nr:MAG: alcohol dehydrogenase [Leifsonia sp. SCN 70-46]OJX87129.1 MAG: alcohol dehydrogenase [Micrococcales bacterium 70-64]